MKKSIVCLGIDPGISNTGWGIVSRASRCSKFVYLDSGVITTSKALALPDRINQIHQNLCPVLLEHPVSMVCVEGVYFNRNVSSCISTAQVIGAVCVAAESVGAAVLVETPQRIKQSVGFGRGASKKQVALAVSRLLHNTSKFNIHHESDSLAAAICGLLITQ